MVNGLESSWILAANGEEQFYRCHVGAASGHSALRRSHTATLPVCRSTFMPAAYPVYIP